MPRKKTSRIRLDRWLVLPLLFLAAVASLVPLIESNTWWIRYLDFPRLQFAIALMVLLVVHLLLRGRRSRRWGSWLTLGLTGAALISHAQHLYPYLLPVEPPAQRVASCPADSRLKLLIANVKMANEQAGELFRIVRGSDPDLLLAMETDPWWDRRLDALNERLPHRVQYIPQQAESYGMHLFSRYPLIEPDVRFRFDERTPAINARVRLPSGALIDFHGVHPRPPLYWSQSTLPRDAQLLATALDIRGRENPSVVAGDFNAVSWEDVTRRMLRLGELLEPRTGRGLYPTFDAHSPVIAWPLDHILYQDEFSLVAFERKPGIGSDHYPVYAELCHRPELAEQQAAPAPAEDDLGEARRTIERAGEPVRAAAP